MSRGEGALVGPFFIIRDLCALGKRDVPSLRLYELVIRVTYCRLMLGREVRALKE